MSFDEVNAYGKAFGAQCARRGTTSGALRQITIEPPIRVPMRTFSVNLGLEGFYESFV